VSFDLVVLPHGSAGSTDFLGLICPLYHTAQSFSFNSQLFTGTSVTRMSSSMTFPWLVDKLSATHRAITHASVPLLEMQTPPNTRSLRNTLYNILVTANDAMTSAQVPETARINCITELANEVVNKAGSTAIRAMFPISWSSIAEYLQSASFVNVFPAMKTAHANAISEITGEAQPISTKIFANLLPALKTVMSFKQTILDQMCIRPSSTQVCVRFLFHPFHFFLFPIPPSYLSVLHHLLSRELVFTCSTLNPFVHYSSISTHVL